MQEAGDVLRYELQPQRCPEGLEAEDVQIFVEVAQPRRERDRFNAGVFCALGESRLYTISGGVGTMDELWEATR